MATLVEFLAPLKKKTHRDRCLAVLYYHEQYRKVPSLTVEGVRTALAQARVPNASKVNVADVLSKSGHFVDAPEADQRGRKLWQLTEPGRQYVRELVGLPDDKPEIEHNVSTLRAVANNVGDDVVRGFVLEAVTCLSVGALRASIVFLWSGAVRRLQEQAFSHGSAAVTSALQKHDPKARRVSRVEDFAHVKDRTMLLAARELGVIDKGEWTILQAALDLRNQCGHPTKYRPGEKKASSFIEDVTGIVFRSGSSAT